MKKPAALMVLIAFCACNGSKNTQEDQPVKDSTQHTALHNPTAHENNTPQTVFVPNKSRYFYGLDTSTITGKISTETFYGPPGYGENPEEDAVEETFFLWLTSPVNVFSNSAEDQENGFDVTYQGVEKIQVYSTHGFDLKKADGKTVQVKGVLFGAHTAHHHADVLMDILEMAELK